MHFTWHNECIYFFIKAVLSGYDFIWEQLNHQQFGLIPVSIPCKQYKIQKRQDVTTELPVSHAVFIVLAKQL